MLLKSLYYLIIDMKSLLLLNIIEGSFPISEAEIDIIFTDIYDTITISAAGDVIASQIQQKTVIL